MKIYSVIFAIGAILYSLIEIMWRGYTHVSMAIAGGLCLMGLFCVEKHSRRMTFWSKCAVGALLITAVEFTVGCVVNKILGLGVWDYSDRPLNIMGQVCPLFTVLWFIISIPAFGICRLIKNGVVDE